MFTMPLLRRPLQVIPSSVQCWRGGVCGSVSVIR